MSPLLGVGNRPFRVTAVAMLGMNIYQHLQRVPRVAWIGVAVFLYALLHVLDSMAPAVEGLPGRELFSKICHVIFYGGLAALLWKILPKPSVSLVVFLVLCASALDEIHQSFLAVHTGQVIDVVIDCVAALVVAMILTNRRHRARLAALDAVGSKP
jgi:VanZ family protein